MVTEAEWLACETPGPMLTFLRGRASERQLRLFACACCRSIFGFIPNGDCREAIEVSLRFADGQATAQELASARARAITATESAGTQTAAAWAACETANPSALNAARATLVEAQEQIRRHSPRAAEEEARVQAGFLRDIVGSPFREFGAASIRRLARNSILREIAEGLYAGGPQEDMQYIAKELERLGCPNSHVMEHCRSSDPHVRGCWVVDLILSVDPQPPPSALANLVDPEPPPSALANRTAASWVQSVRTALQSHLGPKKYRRFLRKAVALSPAPGRVGCPAEWEKFIRLYPDYQVPEDQLHEVFAVCTIHQCELVDRLVRGALDDPALTRDSVFLQARGTQFPYAHEEEVGGDWERQIWWCPDCQRARSEWIANRARLLTLPDFD